MSTDLPSLANADTIVLSNNFHIYFVCGFICIVKLAEVCGGFGNFAVITKHVAI